MPLELLMGYEGALRGSQARGRANPARVCDTPSTMTVVSLFTQPRTHISLQRAGGHVSGPARLRACARA